MQRDDPTYEDDAVELFVNPNPEQQVVYYGFEMNARGVLYDYFLNYPQFILLKAFNLRGFQLATRMNGTLNDSSDKDRGWTLEVAIPWENFGDLAARPKAGTEWRVNLVRWDGTAPARRLSIWSDSALELASPHNPARFGRLKFID
jgi:hypothetical protein